MARPCGSISPGILHRADPDWRAGEAVVWMAGPRQPRYALLRPVASRTPAPSFWWPPRTVAWGKRSRVGNPVRQGGLGGRILVVMKPARAATRRYLPNSPFNT